MHTGRAFLSHAPSGNKCPAGLLCELTKLKQAVLCGVQVLISPVELQSILATLKLRSTSRRERPCVAAGRRITSCSASSQRALDLESDR
jgi:hypothetical protein